MNQKIHFFRVTGQCDKLSDLAQRMMEISPLNLGLLSMATYYLMAEEYSESIQYFDMTLNHMYGYALLKTGKQNEAHEKFEFALNLIRDRGHHTPDYEYAKIYSAMGMV